MVTFYILDVFAEEKFTGNQLAVVKDAGGLSSIKMQQIAREKYFELIRDSHAKAFLVFCPETINMENNISVRVFAMV